MTKSKEKEREKEKSIKKSFNSTDSRFSKIQADARFSIPKKKQLKSDLDSRFTDAIKKNKDFQKKLKVDKYGRKVVNEDIKKDLSKYYNIEESDDSEDEEKVKAELEEESEGTEESSDENIVKKPDYARGEGPSSESSSDSDSDSDEDEDIESEEEELKITEIDDQSIPRGDETNTFACVNMDWDNVKAVDLMATFSSFAPSGGRILSVTIYPSEYGKKMMEIEDSQGPATELFEEKEKKKKKEKEINEKTIVEEDMGEEIDSKKFRKYQLQRLRYYYAVVKCDKVSTARSIYDSCDGSEFESTANFFDLRYVPEGMEFEDEPKDKCDHLPSQFKPSTFVTDALQHSKVKLTWDETPSERLKLSSKSFNQKEIEEMDYKAYIASESESEDDQERADKYKKLLGDFVADRMDNSKEEKDMEITFTPALEEEKTDVKEDEESTIDKYKRKEKERRKKRMEKFKAQQKEKSENNETNGNEKEKAEMELLLMDDDMLKKQSEKKPDEKEETKKKKSKKFKKTKSREHRERLEAEEADFDVEDSRFQQLFENPDFAIDTTLPQFKKTKAMEKIMEERRKRSQGSDATEVPSEKSLKKRKMENEQRSEPTIDGLMRKLKTKKAKNEKKHE